MQVMAYPDREDARLAGLIGASAVMRRARSFVARELDGDRPVLLVGEHGTGKRLVARTLHGRGPRAEQPFTVLHPTAPRFMETLFGAGEQPGRLERGGTLVLVEPEHLPLEVQTRLYRVFTDRHVLRCGARAPRQADVPRLVFVTTQWRFAFIEPRLGQAAARIDLPPLRERLEDVPALVEHLLRDELSFDGYHVQLSRRALGVFGRYRWPGNVKELAKVAHGLVEQHRERARRSATLPADGVWFLPAVWPSDVEVVPQAAPPEPELATALPPREPEPQELPVSRPPVPQPPVLAEPPVAWRPLPVPPRRYRLPRFTRDGVEAALSAAVVFTAAMLLWIHHAGS